MSQVLPLTWAEFQRLLKAPAALYFFLGVVGLLGLMFWLTSTWLVAGFVDFAYLFLPLFFLTLASAQISQDRESGFSTILFTHPISQGEYYAAKFLSLHLVLAVYLLALFPFGVLIVIFAGSGWISEIFWRIGWTLLTTIFVVALGLLISAGLGKRATVPSVSLGFAGAMILMFGPFLAVQYMGALGPDLTPTILALLHVSPLLGAMDTFGSHGLEIIKPLTPILLTGLLSVFLIVVGLLVFRRLQSPEGWEAPIVKRAAAFVVVLGVLLSAPLLIGFEYSAQIGSTSDCREYYDIELCLKGLRMDGDLPYLGSEVRGFLGIRVLNDEAVPVVVNSISLRWHSDYVGFNRTSAEISRIVVPADPDPNPLNRESAEVDIPVTFSVTRVPQLGRPFGGTWVTYSVNVTLPDLTFEIQDWLSVRAPDYDRNTVWLVVLGIAAVSLTLRPLGRFRREGGD